MHGSMVGRRPEGIRPSGIAALLVTASLVGLFAAGTASAQGAAASAATAPSAEADTDIAEITVTARRRAEDLELTPVSATVISGAGLAQQNVRNFQDLRGAVSNLELVPLLSGGTSFTVRGIGQTINQVNSDAKAGFYVDEMYVARQEGNDLYFYDVSSLQVLKGPQGTLFGKNTTAGAILLTTQRPTDQFGGYVQLRAGSYRRIDTEGAINVPIADGLASRLSFRTQNSDGFIKHVLDDGRSGDIDNKSVRLQLSAQGGPLTADLLGEYNRSITDGGATIAVGCLPTASFVRNYDALHTVPFCTAYPVLGKRDLVYGGATLTVPTSAILTDRARGGDATSGGLTRHGRRSPFNDTDVYTLNGRLNYELTDTIALHSVTAYRRSHASFYTPVLNAPNDIYSEFDDTRTNQFTQELTLGGSAIDGNLDFLTGLFYYDQKTSFLQDTGPDWIDPIGYVYDASVRYKSYAAFAQGSYKITPQLELTLGARYTHDTKAGSSYVFFASDPTKTFRGILPGQTTPQTLACVGFVNQFLGGVKNCAGAPFTASQKQSWNGFDPEVQLSYRPTDDVFTYVTAAHGYNAGGFNQQLGSQPANGRYVSFYNPEKLWSYEGGIKIDTLDHRLIVNLAGFYQKYSAIQSTVNIVIDGIPTRQVQSAADAHEKGMEVDFVVRPTPELTLRGNASYLSQAYDKIFPGATTITLDTPVNSAPKYTYSAAVEYALDVGEGILIPSVDVRGLGSKPACQSGANYTCRLPAYALVGFRIDYRPSDDSPVKIGVYGTNVFDKLTQLARTGYFGNFGVDRYTPGRPQEFGVEASYRF
jgi:iron complex outermembrane receptor protein